MSAISEKSSEPVVNESLVRNSGEIAWPIGSRTMKSATSSVSQRPAIARSPSRERGASAGGGASVGAPAARAAPAAGGVTDSASAGTERAPSAQGGVEAEADEAVEGDREEQQRPDRGLLPERVD